MEMVTILFNFIAYLCFFWGGWMMYDFLRLGAKFFKTFNEIQIKIYEQKYEKDNK